LPCAKIKTHGKVSSLPCVFLRRAAKGEKNCPPPLGVNGSAIGVNGGGEKIVCRALRKNARQTQGFAVRLEKTHGKEIFTVRFLFAVRLL
jgi:hypothetical protein